MDPRIRVLYWNRILVPVSAAVHGVAACGAMVASAGDGDEFADDDCRGQHVELGPVPPRSMHCRRSASTGAWPVLIALNPTEGQIVERLWPNEQ